jgi:hypothetical protein
MERPDEASERVSRLARLECREIAAMKVGEVGQLLLSHVAAVTELANGHPE